MFSLTHKERAMLALNHEEPDRIPLDFGSTTSTTIVTRSYESLKKHLGLEHETILMAKRGQIVVPDDLLLEKFDVDFVGLHLGQFAGGNYREIDNNTIVDAWGTVCRKAPDGHYINVDGPLQGSNPKIEILENHMWPDPNDPGLYKGLKEQAEYLRRNNDRAIVLNLPVGIVHQCQFVRGFTEWLMDLITNPEFACRMMDIIADIWIKITQNTLEAVGDNIDVIAWGDDVAIQEGSLINPKITSK